MKEKRILDVLGKVDEKYIEEALPAEFTGFNTKKDAKIPAFLKWGYAAACIALLLALGVPKLLNSRPISVSDRKGMLTAGTAWETDQFTFCVVDAAFCSGYQTEAGDILTPGDGCRFMAVEYRAVFSQSGALSKCALQKGDVYSEGHADPLGPIPSPDGNWVLLFSVPLAESDADTPSRDSYSLRVEIDAGGRTYVQDFAL